MMAWLKKRWIRLAYWMLAKAGEQRGRTPKPFLAFTAERVVKEIDRVHPAADPEFRHSEALRMMLNLHPADKMRDLNFALEWEIQRRHD